MSNFIEGKPKLPLEAMYEIRNKEGSLRALFFELNPKRYGIDIKVRGKNTRSSEFSTFAEAKIWARQVLTAIYEEG